MDNASAVTVKAGISPPEPTPAKASTQAPIRSSTGARRATRQSSSSSSKSKRNETPLGTTKQQPFVCPICFDDTQTKTLSLACDHLYCTGCWNAYITSKIKDEAEHAIRCMAEGCAIICPDPFVQTALEVDENANKEIWSRFQELLVRNFVASLPNLKYCPYPACTYTVSCPSAASQSSLSTIVPTVSCGASATHKVDSHLLISGDYNTYIRDTQFCFGCPIESDHRPVICAVARMWLKKCRDDSETANWIKSNTKECSKCQSTIEKNGGCK
jgi:ariadne-1